MLEGLAYLHCSCIYEQNDETTRISLKPLKGLVGLSLAFCAYITGSQSTEAATTTLQPGDSGAGVEYLKERLRKAWCLPQAITNNDNYDEVTAAAVKSLQRQHGLLMNGVVDEQTAKVIEDGKMCYAPEDSAALKLGDAGEEVRLLKTQLSNWGFPLTGQRLQPTGTFDPTTQVALKEFEDFFGLKPDSILDPLDSALLWKPRQEVLASLLPNLKGAPADILPLIIPLLESQNPDHRKAAIAKLRSRRLYAKEAVPNLTALLQSQDPDDRQNAAGTLGAIGSDAREAVPALITLLESQNQQDRNAAANALGGIGADAKEAVPTLISLLESQHQQDRSAAANALGEIGADAKETVPTLISLLESQHQEDRSAAANALGEIGADAKEAVPTLISLLESQHQQDRNAAANALGGIGADAKEAVPTLISLLESQHQEDRSAAANALGRIGAVEEEVVPALITLLKSANVDDRYSGVEALGNIGPDAEEAVPVLIPLLADNAVDSGAGVFPVSEATMDTLGAIGPKAKAAIPDLVEQLGNPNDKDNAQSKSRVAAINLLHIDPFLNVLLENLTSNNNLAQESSAFALGLTGSADQRVIDNLLGIVNDQAEVIEVRLAAAQSLTLFNQDVSWFYSENGFDSIYKEWLSCPVHPLEGVPAKGSKLFFDPGLRECTDLMTGSGTGPGPLVIGDRILPPPPPPAGKN